MRCVFIFLILIFSQLVLSSEIDDNKKLGIVTYKATIINLESIENAISKIGYSANQTKADPVAYESLASCCKIGS